MPFSLATVENQQEIAPISRTLDSILFTFLLVLTSNKHDFWLDFSNRQGPKKIVIQNWNFAGPILQANQARSEIIQ